MITVPLRESLVKEARHRAKATSKENTLNNSIRHGEGSLVGCLGEMVVAEYLGVDLCNTFDYDLIVDGIRVDVKTKETTVPPQYNYECSIANFNTKQNCDLYAFVRIDKALKLAWILGWIPKHDYYSKARFLRKGQKDGSNNFIVKADCYNLFIYDLLPIECTVKL